MKHTTRHVLIVSRDPAFVSLLGEELDSLGVQLARYAVASPDDPFVHPNPLPPDVIVLDESSFSDSERARPLGEPPPELAAARLAGLAPVIVLAAPEKQSQIAALLACGRADFVARAGDYLPTLISLLERRLRSLDLEAASASPAGGKESMTSFEAPEDFAEILRHELNNPLTGILGNAELLLAEVRRRNDGMLPQGAQRRLETIADLAVRLRETVLRLSQEWEARHDHA